MKKVGVFMRHMTKNHQYAWTSVHTIGMELSEIGLTIKRIRLAQEMTQEDLIERADLSRSQLYYIESGKRLPNFRTMINICMALGLTFKEFVDEWYQ